MVKQGPRVLVADDREDILKALRALLKSRGIRAETARTPADALNRLKADDYDLALLDLNYTREITSGEEGLDLLCAVRRLAPDMPVVVMTAWASVELAMTAVRRGANDFVEKPWDNQRLMSIVQNQLALGRALAAERKLTEENRLLRGDDEPAMIAESAAMQPVLELIERIGPTDANVLVTGEHGTGKGVVARMLHRASRRADQPLVTVNIGALSDSLFESELFGHVKGAFTDAQTAREGRFHLADGGALFLDEIGNLSLPLQAKMLRVIETGEYEPVGSSRTRRANVRLISATNADLSAMAARGAFREDLLFRLNAIEIRLPPLRERNGDIALLADWFLHRHRARHGRRELVFAPESLAALRRHRWPGNVRELDHAVQRGVLMARGSRILPNDLGLAARRDGDAPQWEDMTLAEAERLLVEKALAREGGNVKQAAARLGLSRGAFYRRLKKHGMDRDERPES